MSRSHSLSDTKSDITFQNPNENKDIYKEDTLHKDERTDGGNFGNARNPFGIEFSVNPQAALDKLNKEFYNESFDPVRDLLEALPSNISDMGSFMMHQQETKDLARDAIQSQLTKAVLSNYNDLVGGMKHIQDIDYDITRATIQVTNGLRQIRSSKHHFVQASLEICNKRRRRERLTQTRDRLTWLQSLSTAQSDIDRACMEYKFPEAVTILKRSQHQLGDAALQRYSVLSTVRSSLLCDNAWDIIRAKADVALLRLCREWTSSDPLPSRNESAISGILQSPIAMQTGTNEEVPSKTTSALSLAQFSDAYVNIIGSYAVFDNQTQHLSKSDAEAQINDFRHVHELRNNHVWATLDNASNSFTHMNIIGEKIHNCILHTLYQATQQALVDVLLRASGIYARARAALFAKHKRSAKASSASHTRDSDASTSDQVDDHDSAAEAIQAEEDDTIQQFCNEVERLSDMQYSELCAELSTLIAEKQSGVDPNQTGKGLLAHGDISHSSMFQDFRNSAAFSGNVEHDSPNSAEALIVYGLKKILSAITSVLHCHYLLMQWHRTPFDKRNRSWAYLHRCSIDEEDSSTGTETSLPEHINAEQVKYLTNLRKTHLLQSRETIWRACQSRIVSYFLSISSNHGGDIPERGMMRCLAASFDFMHIGAEYMGILSPDKLASCIPNTSQRRSSNDEKDFENESFKETSVDMSHQNTTKLWQILDNASELRDGIQTALTQIVTMLRTQALSKLRASLNKDLWERVPFPSDTLGELLCGIGKSSSVLSYFAEADLNIHAHTPKISVTDEELGEIDTPFLAELQRALVMFFTLRGNGQRGTVVLSGEAINSCDLARNLDPTIAAAFLSTSTDIGSGFILGTEAENLLMRTCGYSLEHNGLPLEWYIDIQWHKNHKSMDYVHLDDQLDAASHSGLPSFSNATKDIFESQGLNHAITTSSRSITDHSLLNGFAASSCIISFLFQRALLGYVFPVWLRGRVFQKYGDWSGFHSQFARNMGETLKYAWDSMETEVASGVESLHTQFPGQSFSHLLPTGNPFGQNHTVDSAYELASSSLHGSRITAIDIAQTFTPNTDHLEEAMYAACKLDIRKPVKTSSKPLAKKSSRLLAAQRFNSTASSEDEEWYTEASEDVNDVDSEHEQEEILTNNSEISSAMKSSVQSNIDLIPGLSSLQRTVLKILDPQIMDNVPTAFKELGAQRRSILSNEHNKVDTATLLNSSKGLTKLIQSHFSLVATSSVLNGISTALSRYMRLIKCFPSIAVDIWQAIADLARLYIASVCTAFLPSKSLTCTIEEQGKRLTQIIDAASTRVKSNTTFERFESEDIASNLLFELEDPSSFDSAAVSTSVRTGLATMTAASVQLLLVDLARDVCSLDSPSQAAELLERVGISSVSVDGKIISAAATLALQRISFKDSNVFDHEHGDSHERKLESLKSFIQHKASGQTENNDQTVLIGRLADVYTALINQNRHTLLHDSGFSVFASLLHEISVDPDVVPQLSLRDTVLSVLSSLSRYTTKTNSTGYIPAYQEDETDEVESNSSQPNSPDARNSTSTPSKSFMNNVHDEERSDAMSPLVARIGPLFSRRQTMSDKKQAAGTSDVILQKLKSILHLNATTPSPAIEVAADLGEDTNFGSSSQSIRPTNQASLEGAGMSARSIASESLLYVLALLCAGRKWIDVGVPITGQQSVQAWFKSIATSIFQLRAAIHSSMACQLIPEIDNLSRSISQQKWSSVSEMRDTLDHSAYVKPICEAICRGGTTIKQLGNASFMANLPSSATLNITAYLADHTLLRFLQGVTLVSSCSIPGRGLMAMDADTIFRCLTKQLQVSDDIRLRTQEKLTQYIQAFYFANDEDVSSWISERKTEYPFIAFHSLLAHNKKGDKKYKQKIKTLEKEAALQIAKQLNVVFGLS